MKFKNITGDVHFFFLLIFFFAITNCYGQESCNLKSNNSTGECRNAKDCSSVLQQIRNGQRDYTICKITRHEFVICCPELTIPTIPTTTTTTTTTTTERPDAAVSTPPKKRISEIKSCVLNSDYLTAEYRIDCRVCRNAKECTILQREIGNSKQDLAVCSTKNLETLVCWPQVTPSTTTIMSSNDQTSQTGVGVKRISEKKCQEYASYVYEKSLMNLMPGAMPKEINIDRCGIKAERLSPHVKKATAREFPHIALIGLETKNGKRWACGGTLISEKYVLTVAHCLNTSLGQPKYVRLGKLSVGEGENYDDAEEFLVGEVISHPNFERRSKYDDIALIKLDRNVTFNPYKRPACLSKSYESDSNEVIATGWEKNKQTGENSDILKKVTLEKINQTDCFNAYKQIAFSNMPHGIKQDSHICARPTTENEDNFQGNSGDPLQIYDINNYCMYEIVGISSFGLRAGKLGIPDVYTRVYLYLDWIENIVWESN